MFRSPVVNIRSEWGRKMEWVRLDYECCQKERNGVKSVFGICGVIRVRTFTIEEEKISLRRIPKKHSDCKSCLSQEIGMNKY